MNTKADTLTTQKQPEVEPEGQESYIVTEGKKRGSTRDVRPEAAYDRYYTVLRVHAAMPSSRQLAHERGAGSRTQQLRGRYLRHAHAGGLGRNDRKRSPAPTTPPATNLDDGPRAFRRQKKRLPGTGPVNNPAKK